jgi:hypothetical protein
MNFFVIFFLTTLPAGISILFLKINKKKIDAIMLKHDHKYISKPNSNDILKIFRIYKNCGSLTKNEKHFLLITTICLFIGELTALIWLILFLFFRHLFYQ